MRIMCRKLMHVVLLCLLSSSKDDSAAKSRPCEESAMAPKNGLDFSHQAYFRHSKAVFAQVQAPFSSILAGASDRRGRSGESLTCEQSHCASRNCKVTVNFKKIVIRPLG